MTGDLDRLPVIVAACATGTAAVLVFALLPVVSGSFADQYGLDEVQTGLLASAYFGIYAVIALTSGVWIRRVNWISAKRIGFAGMLCGLGLCLLAESFAAACIGLAVIGSGAGLLFPVSLTLVSDMTHTDRNYAIKLSAEQLVPAAMLFLLSSTLLVGYGPAQLTIMLGAVVLACFFLAFGLPARGRPAQHIESATDRGATLAVVSLVALTINFCGFAGLWAFLERIASERGFDASFTNLWLGVGLIGSGLGPLAAAMLGDRRGRLPPLAGGTAVSLLALFLLSGESGRVDYAIVLTLLPLAYYFSIAFMFAVVAQADHNGRMAGLMSFALAVGAGTGPALFGLLKAGGGPVVLMMGFLIGSGAALLGWVHTRLQPSKPGPMT